MAFQIGGSLLEACVLAILRGEATYGYKLTQEVREAIEVSESTLYPVLRRLQKEGYLETFDKPHQGRNRRYYRITPIGEARVSEQIAEWKTYKERVDHVLVGGNKDE